MTDLKSCPFCGHSASTEEFGSAGGGDKAVWEVGCDNFDECIADAPAIRGFPTEKAAIKAWNTRTGVHIEKGLNDDIRD